MGHENGREDIMRIHIIKSKQTHASACTVLALLLAAVLSSCSGKKAADIDWTETVEKSLASYNGDFAVEGPSIEEDGDRVVYTATTLDEYAITFQIICWYNRPTSPIGGRLPFKKKQYSNTLYTEVQHWISKEYGTVDITDMTVEETIEYIDFVMDQARDAADFYGIRQAEWQQPNIDFVITNKKTTCYISMIPMTEERIRMILMDNFQKN